MQECIDQMGRKISVPSFPKRIVSLVPSISDLICHLGFENQLVGVTKYCIEPASLQKEKEIVGGTKKFDLELIQDLEPDLIIGDKEENYEEGINFLSSRFPTWMCDFNSIDGSFEMIKMLGEVLQCQEKSTQLIYDIQSGISTFNSSLGYSVGYFIWRKPFMVAASNTYIDDVLSQLGFSNAFHKLDRYPALEAVEIRAANPSIIFLSTEPFPFAEKHIEELANLCPNAYVMLVDGASFSWSGPRLLYAMDYFSELVAQIHLKLR